jgi:hypothetical protein
MADNRNKDMMQRIQIGLTGLAGVVLLVGLANIVIEKAGMEMTETVPEGAPPQVVATTGANATDTASEPLAELGVTPPPPEGGAPPGQTVPDLEPNPALDKPMDR